MPDGADELLVAARPGLQVRCAAESNLGAHQKEIKEKNGKKNGNGLYC